MTARKLGILTSGGDSPGMNAAIRAVVRSGIEAGFEVYGIYRGYEGLLDGEIERLTKNSVADILQRGGTMLKTARSERFMSEEGRNHAAVVLKTFGIDNLVVIGGDGSLRGASELSDRGISVMGIPGTIDNDLGYTDFTIGFDTAVTTVLEAITKLRDTSYAHERAVIIEVMGRHCGDIALYAGVTGGAEDVIIPEVEFDQVELCRKIIMSSNRGKKHNIIIKAEGVGIESSELAQTIQKTTGRETKVVVLSYLQRGGTPTMRDRLLATICGTKAVELLSQYSESKAIGVVDGKVIGFDLKEALERKREFNEGLYGVIHILGK